MSQLIALSTLFALVAAAPVLAQEEDFARSGFYAGINAAGAAYMELDGDVRDGLVALGYAPDPDGEEPPGVGARVGYRFLRYLAGEAQLQWLSHAKSEFSGYLVADPDQKKLRDVPVLRVESLTFTGNAKGYLLTGRFQPFILAGAGLIQYDIEEKLPVGLASDGVDFVGRFGGGIEIYFNQHIVITLDSSYLLPTGGASGLDQVQVAIGLNYRF